MITAKLASKLASDLVNKSAANVVNAWTALKPTIAVKANPVPNPFRDSLLTDNY